MIASCLFVAAACGSTVDVIELHPDQVDGGIADASSDATTPSDAIASDEGPGVAETIFVSASSGNDANDGRSPATPKRSISAGIAAAHAIAGAPAEVHVCQGAYAETALVLSYPIALRGGYDCTTWARPAGFAAPTYDGVLQTVITNAAGAAAQNDTLTIDGALADRRAVVEGFSIVAVGGTALRVDHGATARVLNDRIHGETTGTLGACGVEIFGVSSPEIALDAIESVCTLQIVTNTALALYSGSPHIHDNVITAASAYCGSLAVGLSTGSPDYLYGDSVMTEETGNAFEHNIVSGGGRGVALLGPVVADIADNDIRGTTTSGVDGEARGISAHILPQGRLRILRNRIYGGDASQSIGAEISGSGVVLANNMIHAGKSDLGPPSSTIALFLDDAPNAIVVYNTLYDGTPFDATSVHTDVMLNGTAGTTRPVAFMNNIFAGSGGSDVAILDNGTASEFETFTNNVVLNQGIGIYGLRGCEGAGLCFNGVFQTTTTIAETEAAFHAENVDAGAPGGAAHDNLLLPSTCPDGGACVGDLASLFASFSAPPDDGFSDLVGTGFVLAPTAPCSVAHGGATAFITNDLYGATRSLTTPSMGAAEFVGMCAP